MSERIESANTNSPPPVRPEPVEGSVDTSSVGQAEQKEEPGFLSKASDMIGGIFTDTAPKTGPRGGTIRSRQGVGEAVVKSAARAIGSEVGRRVIRGVLGSIFGGKR